MYAKENWYALLLSIVTDIGRTESLRTLGINVQIEINPKIEFRKLSDDEKENVNYLYHIKGLTQTQIGKLYNTTGVTVGNYMKRVGIPARNLSEAKQLMFQKICI